MQKLGLVATLLCGLLWAGNADAKVLELYAQAQGGGGSGRGVAGALKDFDFFEGAGGASYGAKVGAEFLWIDGWVEHNQFTDGSVTGTWTQFMFGMDWDFPIGDEPEPGQKPKTYGNIGFAAGFGLGTGRQVDPPLSNDEITDKGFVGQVSFGAEYRMNKVMAIGVNVPISYGYMFKTCGGGCSANDENNQYQSVSAMGLVVLRFFVDIK
jgi:hypothetical protein